MDPAPGSSYGVPVPGTRRVISAAALVMAAGCSTGTAATALPDGPTRTAAATTPATVTPTPTATAEPGPVEVYTAWWTALEHAYGAGDPDDPALAEYAVDPILSRQRHSITTLTQQGIVQRTKFTLTPHLRYSDGGNAEIEDCVRGPANTYYDAVTGRPRAPAGYSNDAPTEDRLLTSLRKEGDRWYVVAATGKGDVQC